MALAYGAEEIRHCNSMTIDVTMNINLLWPDGRVDRALGYLRHQYMMHAEEIMVINVVVDH